MYYWRKYTTLTSFWYHQHTLTSDRLCILLKKVYYIDIILIPWTYVDQWHTRYTIEESILHWHHFHTWDESVRSVSLSCLKKMLLKGFSFGNRYNLLQLKCCRRSCLGELCQNKFRHFPFSKKKILNKPPQRLIFGQHKMWALIALLKLTSGKRLYLHELIHKKESYFLLTYPNI